MVKKFSIKTESKNGYTIVADAKGTLLWKHDNEYDKPHIIITAEQVNREYLRYLDDKDISLSRRDTEKLI